MSPELEKVLKKKREAFRQKFGRDPGPEDPVFYDPDADTPQPLDADKIDHLMIEAMVQAGLDAAYIYAYQRTGLLVTEDNIDSLSEQDLAEWQLAIQEYEDKTKGRPS